MTKTLNSAMLQMIFTASQTNSNALGGAIFAPALNKKLDFANGTASGQADIVFTDERTVNAASNDDIDLAGVLSDAFGGTITAAEVVGIVIVAAAANGNALSVGGGSNPWITAWLATGDGIKVFPNGVFCNFAYDAVGLGTVTAGTGDILRVANAGGAACTYKIVILARTA